LISFSEISTLDPELAKGNGERTPVIINTGVQVARFHSDRGPSLRFGVTEKAIYPELTALPSRNYCQPGNAKDDNFAIPVNNRVLLSSDILRGAPY
jgi:hypothetical protein